MRQGQQNRRGRGRGRKPQNPLSRNYESNGPDVKIRGTAAHIAEKYVSEFIDEFFENIYSLHFHDNLLSHDDHMIPGDGMGPISLVIKKLKEKNYKGSFCFELKTENDWREKYKDKNILEIYKIAYDRLLNMLSNKGFF